MPLTPTHPPIHRTEAVALIHQIDLLLEQSRLTLAALDLTRWDHRQKATEIKGAIDKLLDRRLTYMEARDRRFPALKGAAVRATTPIGA